MFGIAKQIKRLADAAEASRPPDMTEELRDFMAKAAERAEIDNRGLADHYARVRANEQAMKETLAGWNAALQEVRERIVALEARVEGEGWRQ